VQSECIPQAILGICPLPSKVWHGKDCGLCVDYSSTAGATGG
jgi:hypothetical protein